MTPTADDLAARLAKLPHMPEDAQRWVVDAIAALRALEAKQGEDARDAARWADLKRDPVGYRHMLFLLSEGKGDWAAFNSMCDRIRASYKAAIQQSGDKK